MKYTKKHIFAQPEAVDDIIDSISKYAENFEKIDELLPKSVPNISLYLEVDKKYDIGSIIYNDSPSVGGFVGWVNIRTGKHANEWEKERSYAVNDVVVSSPNNGYFYRCITDGMSSVKQPSFPTTMNSKVDDTYGIVSWTPSKVYAKDDIVKKTSGGSSYYYKCITAGTSSNIEPNWRDVSGVIIVDGSVSWMVCKKAVWELQDYSSEFRPFGEIK